MTDDKSAGLLAGKIAFVTGAGRGIGAAAARLFAREGATVLLAARTEGQLKAVTEEIRAAGGTADHVVCDLADPAGVRAAVDRVVELYGRLDVAFNNGATAVPPAPMDRIPEADFDLMYTVNLKGSGSPCPPKWPPSGPPPEPGRSSTPPPSAVGGRTPCCPRTAR
ncbi:SDR family NAD(P)-dependent oxidoreductase [Nonomuraea antimicrobica]